MPGTGIVSDSTSLKKPNLSNLNFEFSIRLLEAHAPSICLISLLKTTSCVLLLPLKTILLTYVLCCGSTKKVRSTFPDSSSTSGTPLTSAKLYPSLPNIFLNISSVSVTKNWLNLSPFFMRMSDFRISSSTGKSPTIFISLTS